MTKKTDEIVEVFEVSDPELLLSAGRDYAEAVSRGEMTPAEANERTIALARRMRITSVT